MDDVWRELLETVDGSFGGRGWSVYARLIGCPHATSTGPRPLDVGSTIPGFRVAVVHPGQELRLEGRHRFSTYALSFHLTSVGERSTRLVARSDAVFPGVGGRLYRLLVTGTGIHVAGVRGLLTAVQRRAERR